MADAGTDLGAQAELLRLLAVKRFNRHATPASVRRLIADLAECKAAFLDWREGERRANAQEPKRSLVLPRQSDDVHSGLGRVVRLAGKLRHEITATPTGRHVLRHSWDAVASGVEWRTVLDTIAELERLGKTLHEEGRNRKRGAPGLALRRAFAVKIGATLERAGYRVTKSEAGAFARVMAIMLAEVDERVPADMRTLAENTAAELQNPPAYIRLLSKPTTGIKSPR